MSLYPDLMLEIYRTQCSIDNDQGPYSSHNVWLARAYECNASNYLYENLYIYWVLHLRALRKFHLVLCVYKDNLLCCNRRSWSFIGQLWLRLRRGHKTPSTNVLIEICNTTHTSCDRTSHMTRAYVAWPLYNDHFKCYNHL